MCCGTGSTSFYPNKALWGIQLQTRKKGYKKDYVNLIGYVLKEKALRDASPRATVMRSHWCIISTGPARRAQLALSADFSHTDMGDVPGFGSHENVNIPIQCNKE